MFYKENKAFSTAYGLIDTATRYKMILNDEYLVKNTAG